MYTHILLAVDIDEPASWRDALPVAERLARCFEGRITICSVVSDAEAIASEETLPIAYQERLFAARSSLDSLTARVGPGIEVEVEVGTGTICGGIVDIADRIDADLIVLASHHPSLRDYLLAAHAARVARRATCSVLVVRDRMVRPDGATIGSGGAGEPGHSATSV